MANNSDRSRPGETKFVDVDYDDQYLKQKNDVVFVQRNSIIGSHTKNYKVKKIKKLESLNVTSPKKVDAHTKFKERLKKDFTVEQTELRGSQTYSRALYAHAREYDHWIKQYDTKLQNGLVMMSNI
jgi:hypothetical protein